jgi:hypothetical protein
MALAAFTTIHRLHRESSDKQAINTNKIMLMLPEQWQIANPSAAQLISMGENAKL